MPSFLHLKMRLRVIKHLPHKLLWRLMASCVKHFHSAWLIVNSQWSWLLLLSNCSQPCNALFLLKALSDSPLPEAFLCNSFTWLLCSGYRSSTVIQLLNVPCTALQPMKSVSSVSLETVEGSCFRPCCLFFVPYKNSVQHTPFADWLVTVAFKDGLRYGQSHWHQ